MKHLDLQYYWLRDAVADGTITLEYISTAIMPADILTKTLLQIKTQEMYILLGLRGSRLGGMSNELVAVDHW